jgi:hypothetical protein
MKDTQPPSPCRLHQPDSDVPDSASGRVRVGFIMKPEMLEQDLYTFMGTSYLVHTCSGSRTLMPSLLLGPICPSTI